MPAWIASALRMLAAAGLFGAGQAVGGALGEIVGGEGVGQLTSGSRGPQIIEGVLIPPHPHRRRRRRALTASDRADIAFIAGLPGKPAGKDFAVIIGAKNR